MKKISIRPPFSKSGVLITVAAVIVLGFFWTGTSTFEERVITARYLLFALTALIAFITPYVLFPDSNIPVVQLGNLSAFSVREYILNKTLILSLPVYLLITCIYFIDIRHPLEFLYEKFLFTVSSLTFFSSLLLFAISRYLKSGESSQFWKESEKGKKLREDMANYFKYPLDPGSLPSLLNTVLIFSAGSVALVAGVYVQNSFTIFAELLLYLVLMLTGIYLYVKDGESSLRYYYSANAFFREFFGVSMKGEEVANKREVGQLWWVPARLKVHVWQFLLQTDRKIPAGRTVAAGHVAVWFIAYQRPDPQFLTVIWILFAVLHHLLTVLTIQQEMAPHWFLRWMDKGSVWMLSRFWMQLRWLVPLLLSMNVQYFIFGVPDFYEQGLIAAFFLVGSLLASIFGTIKLRQDLKT